MGCGIEHLSNCHGEWGVISGLLLTGTSAALWLRLKYKDLRFKTRIWLANRKIKKIKNQI